MIAIPTTLPYVVGTWHTAQMGNLNRLRLALHMIMRWNVARSHDEAIRILSEEGLSHDGNELDISCQPGCWTMVQLVFQYALVDEYTTTVTQRIRICEKGERYE